MSCIKSSLLIFLFVFSFNAFANVERYVVMIDGKFVVFDDSSCGETVLCADGYTMTGLDRFGNHRDYIYPQRKVSYEEYLNAYKSYDADGYDEYGFDMNQKNKNGIHAKNSEILVNVFPNNNN